MNRRPGVTLVEVLVAILITGVGLLALLTLFPLGALEMAQSIRDDRCGHIKHNAVAAANIWDIRKDPLVFAAMTNPGNGLPPPAADGPSYPVFVDPIGWWTNVGTNWQDWMAGQGPGGQYLVPRRVTLNQFSPTSPDQFSPSSPTTNFPLNMPAGYRQQQLLRWMTFLDDMRFPRDDPSGVPVGRPCVPGGVVDRAPVYSWAYVCRMPKSSALNVFQLTVVVYQGRPLTLAATGEKAYSAQFTPGGTVVTLSWGAGQSPPDVSTGRWIFDGTMTPDPRGYFYRVINVTQTSATTMDVEVQTPLRGAGSTGVVIVLDNVIEVFERGTL